MQENGQEQSLVQVEEKIKGMRSLVEATVVTNEDELKAVSDVIKNVKTMGKFVRQEMERYTKPAQEIINNARLKFLPYEKECADAESALKLKAKRYMDDKEKKRIEAEAKIEHAVETGRIKEDTAVRKLEDLGEQKQTVSGGESQITARKVKKAYIIDPEKVPHEYWIIDEARVKKAALAGAEIPGVEVREESEIAVR